MSAPDANGWMPIESAPKDGSPIDIWANGRRRANFRFDADFPYPAFSDAEHSRRHWRDRAFHHPQYVTHWRSAPKPPVAA